MTLMVGHSLNLMGKYYDNYSDILIGTNGSDFIYGLGGNDFIYGEGGDDQISGGEGDDYVYATGTGMNGHWGLDRVWGGNGADHLIFTNNMDRVELYGEAGVDTLLGGSGNDYLSGGNDTDYLYGLGGADYIDGGSGKDWMEGGANNDYFAFKFGDSYSSSRWTADNVSDFNKWEGDRIDVDVAAGNGGNYAGFGGNFWNGEASDWNSGVVHANDIVRNDSHMKYVFLQLNDGSNDGVLFSDLNNDHQINSAIVLHGVHRDGFTWDCIV